MKGLSKLEPADWTETHICTSVIYNVCHDLQLNIYQLLKMVSQVFTDLCKMEQILLKTNVV